MTTQQQTPRMLTVRQAAELMGIQRWRLYSMLAKGDGPPAMRFGRTWRLPEHLLVQWIEEQSTKVKGE